jgi:ATP-dependent Clp protease ATP-binding subunit ClpA
LEENAFELELTTEARQFLLTRGTSLEYGARELKRTILRTLTQPLAALVEQGKIPAGGFVVIEVDDHGLVLNVED